MLSLLVHGVCVFVCADDQQSLYSAGVYNGSDLFVWNGTEVTHSTTVMYSTHC